MVNRNRGSSKLSKKGINNLKRGIDIHLSQDGFLEHWKGQYRKFEVKTRQTLTKAINGEPIDHKSMISLAAASKTPIAEMTDKGDTLINKAEISENLTLAGEEVWGFNIAGLYDLANYAGDIEEEEEWEERYEQYIQSYDIYPVFDGNFIVGILHPKSNSALAKLMLQPNYNSDAQSFISPDDYKKEISPRKELWRPIRGIQHSENVEKALKDIRDAMKNLENTQKNFDSLGDVISHIGGSSQGREDLYRAMDALEAAGAHILADEVRGLGLTGVKRLSEDDDQMTGCWKPIRCKLFVIAPVEVKECRLDYRAYYDPSNWYGEH